MSYPAVPEFMTVMAVASIVFSFVLIALSIVVIVRLTRPRERTDSKSILDERLARGEIDPDEYRERLALLNGGR